MSDSSESSGNSCGDEKRPKELFSFAAARTKEQMKPYVMQTKTQGFLSIHYISYWDSKEAEIAAKKIEVGIEGIHYAEIGVLVPNIEIAAAMQLDNQELDATPGRTELLQNSMLAELGVKGAVTNTILYKEMKVDGARHWVQRIHERLFMKVKPSTIPANYLVVIMELLTKPGKLLMRLKERLYQGVKKRKTHKKNKACNLVLAHILTKSKTYQEYVKRNAMIQKGKASAEKIRQVVTEKVATVRKEGQERSTTR
jgi:hypothetical protein